jgi:hypothetical protein
MSSSGTHPAPIAASYGLFDSQFTELPCRTFLIPILFAPARVLTSDCAACRLVSVRCRPGICRGDKSAAAPQCDDTNFNVRICRIFN